MLLVLVTLSMSVAAVAALGVLAFVDVAFRRPEFALASASRREVSEPSTFEWFSATAERLTRSLIDARRDAGEAYFTGGIHCGTAEPGHGIRKHEPIDSGFCSTSTGATGPEVLEIAEYVRNTQPKNRVESILHDAENCSGRCPLACDDGTCVAMPVRPVQCRVHCALFGHEVATAKDDENVQAAVNGANDGLRKAMTSAHLDVELYELNSALATALSVPDAAQQWSDGENPFAKCKTYSV